MDNNHFHAAFTDHVRWLTAEWKKNCQQKIPQKNSCRMIFGSIQNHVITYDRNESQTIMNIQEIVPQHGFQLRSKTSSIM